MIIEITITRTRNGRQLETKALLGGEGGWSQYGGTTQELGETRDLVAALAETAAEHAQDLED